VSDFIFLGSKITADGGVVVDAVVIIVQGCYGLGSGCDGC